MTTRAAPGGGTSTLSAWIRARREAAESAEWHDYTDSIEDAPTYALVLSVLDAADRRRQAWDDYNNRDRHREAFTAAVAAETAEDAALQALTDHVRATSESEVG